MTDLAQLKEITRMNRQLRRAERSLLRHFAAQHGLTPNQLLVLDTVTDDPGLSLSQLANLIQLNKSTVSTVLDGLLQRGLVAAQPDPANASRYQITITAAGQQVTEGIYAAYLRALSDQLQLTDGEIQTIAVFLHRLTTRLKKAGPV